MSLTSAFISSILIIHLAFAAMAQESSSTESNQSQVLRLTPSSKIEFAGIPQGQKLIGIVDNFVTRTEDLERQIRLGTNDSVSQQEYLKYLRDGVKDWQESERESLAAVVVELAEAMAGFSLPFPDTIYFVRVARNVESNAPHTRGPAVILPDSFFRSPARMKTVLAHELFHVLSSHNPQLRDKLYATIGFVRCNEIELPASLKRKRLTNPDAPVLEHRIHVTTNPGESIDLVPITFMNREQYEGGGLFDYIDFQLLEIEQVGEKWQPKLRDGLPLLQSPNAVPDFHRQIGGNTGYIIHPEETLADNFWMLVLGRKDLPDEWVIEKMREILLSK